MANPLFPRANQALQELRDLIGGRRSMSRNQIERRVRMLESVLRRSRSRSSSTEGRLVREILNLIPGTPDVPDIVSSVINQGGLLGRALGQLRRIHRRQELEGRLAGLIQSAEELASHIESPGSIPIGRAERVQRRRPQPLEDGALPRNVTVRGNRYIVNSMGIRREYAPDHPAMTGRMVRVQSSNVHSIGYEFNFDNPWKSRLIVRFLQPDRKHSGKQSDAPKVAGPSYAYKDVPPEMFNEFLQVSSKGKWVWDNMRIRGTVAGHQYRYTLLSISQRYMPRRARVINDRQRLVRRHGPVRHADGVVEVMRSQLHSRDIGAYRPSVKRPNYGNMDRR